jgi:hypothetical protein
MSIEQRSLAVDFSGNLSTPQFHNEIKANADIGPLFTGISTDDDNINIVFSGNLQPTQIANLNVLIHNHVPVETIPKINFTRVQPIIKKITGTKLTEDAIFLYQGSKISGKINSIECIAKSTKKLCPFRVRLLSTCQNKQIMNKTIVVDDFQVVDIGDISQANIPETPTILTFDVKNEDPDNTIYIEEFIVYHGNENLNGSIL